MIADSPLQFTSMIGGSKLRENMLSRPRDSYSITIYNRTQTRVVNVHRTREGPEQVSSFVLKLLAKHKCKESENT